MVSEAFLWKVVLKKHNLLQNYNFFHFLSPGAPGRGDGSGGFFRRRGGEVRGGRFAVSQAFFWRVVLKEYNFS